MIDDPELDKARQHVLELFHDERVLSPRVIIDRLRAQGVNEDLVRAANIALVASGLLVITPEFRLRMAEAA